MINDILAAIGDLFDGDRALMILAAAALAISAIGHLVLTILKSDAHLRRRIDGAAVAEPRSRASKAGAVMARVGGRFDASPPNDRKALRHRMILAGYHDPRAPHWFVGVRVLCVPVFAVAGALLTWWMWPESEPGAVAARALAAGMAGYLAPSFLLERRIKRRKEQHVDGFPDFMDLMVVCCQAGLSMEAAINRVARELALTYPSLGHNLSIATLELRGGRSLGSAIDALSKRLGIAEAASFSTLLTQSEELGSSLTQSLRAYSEDMRNKRMMRAEEKANALPAKLVIPLTLFVFPVLMVVIMLPVVIGAMAS